MTEEIENYPGINRHQRTYQIEQSFWVNLISCCWRGTLFQNQIWGSLDREGPNDATWDRLFDPIPLISFEGSFTLLLLFGTCHDETHRRAGLPLMLLLNVKRRVPVTLALIGSFGPGSVWLAAEYLFGCSTGSASILWGSKTCWLLSRLVTGFKYEWVWYAQLKKETNSPDVLQSGPASQPGSFDNDGLEIRRIRGDVNNNNAKCECSAKFLVLQGRGQVVSFGRLCLLCSQLLLAGWLEIGEHKELAQVEISKLVVVFRAAGTAVRVSLLAPW